MQIGQRVLQQPKKPRSGFYSCAFYTIQGRNRSKAAGSISHRQQATQSHKKPIQATKDHSRTTGKEAPRKAHTGQNTKQDGWKAGSIHSRPKRRRNGRKASQARETPKARQKAAKLSEMRVKAGKAYNRPRQRASVDKKTLNRRQPARHNGSRPEAHHMQTTESRKQITGEALKKPDGTSPKRPQKGTEAAKPSRLPQRSRKARKRPKSKPQGHTGSEAKQARPAAGKPKKRHENQKISQKIVSNLFFHGRIREKSGKNKKIKIN